VAAGPCYNSFNTNCTENAFSNCSSLILCLVDIV
jgi:hypothetical protein